MNILLTCAATARRRYDADALTWIQGVETADGQGLEIGVKIAVDALVRSLKTNNEWDRLSIMRLYAGPRTLAGLAVPLKGTAPVLYNFVSGDLNRKTGLRGDASTKYIDEARNNNAEAQNDRSLWSWVSADSLTNGRYFMGAGNSGGQTRVHRTTATSVTLRACDGTSITVSGGATLGFLGISRAASGSYAARRNSATSTQTATSASPYNGNIFNFANNEGTPSGRSDYRCAGLGFGKAWAGDGSQIQTAFSSYLSAIAASIP